MTLCVRAIIIKTPIRVTFVRLNYILCHSRFYSSSERHSTVCRSAECHVGDGLPFHPVVSLVRVAGEDAEAADDDEDNDGRWPPGRNVIKRFPSLK